MASSSFTTHLGLCDWAASDRPKRADFVSDNTIIDTQLGGHIANGNIHLSADEKAKLDEPFVGLDPKASFIMKNKLRELCDHGGSVFFSSHVLEVVQNLCDEIAIIKQGSIIMNGKTDEILQSGESLEQIFLDTENIAS